MSSIDKKKRDLVENTKATLSRKKRMQPHGKCRSYVNVVDIIEVYQPAALVVLTSGQKAPETPLNAALRAKFNIVRFPHPIRITKF